MTLDRDGKFSAAFRDAVSGAGIRVIQCPPHAPNCNAYAERFVRSIKSECLNRMIFVGSGTLRHARAEYCAHYNPERPHQGLGNRLIHSQPRLVSPADRVDRNARLGGLLNFYRRAAA